jgi:coproporphyrinogen III oxidase
MTPVDVDALRAHLLDFQDRLCAVVERVDGSAAFRREEREGERGGLARPRVLEDGRVVEKAAVMFSHTRGEALPKAATVRRPELAGRSFEAVSVSWIVHPANPFVPTSHGNVRLFVATAPRSEPLWWFGGGFDLTPTYGFDDDCIHWHRAARDAVESVLPGRHRAMKLRCDQYFHLPHRGEPRGIGGIFYDDHGAADLGDFGTGVALTRAVADGYIAGWVPIVERRKDTPFGERERDFQLWRRGRYAEFNLVHDRGTRFGLESGSRAESVLASLPPLVRWRYDWRAEPGSREAALARYLVPRDWLRDGAPPEDPTAASITPDHRA